MKLHLALLVTSLMLGCQSQPGELPQPQSEVEEACADSPPTQFGYIPQQVYPYRWSAVYNPQDASEIAYLMDTVNPHTPGPRLRNLWVHNLRTGGGRRLVTNVESGPDWGRRGWLLVVRADGQIWKVKNSGDSLTQLTSRGFHHSPSWNQAGTEFACSRRLDSNTNTGLAIHRADGTLVRFISTAQRTVFHPLAWSPDGQRIAGLYAGSGRQMVSTYDLSTGRIEELAAPLPNLGVSSIRWLPNSRDIVWADIHQGVSITSTATRETRLIRAVCPGGTRSFSTVSASPDGQRLLMLRVDGQPSDPYMTLTASLETTNLNGKDVRKIRF